MAPLEKPPEGGSTYLTVVIEALVGWLSPRAWLRKLRGR